jgi:EmrB/QacA subfamily drug resistance transporter
MTRSDTTDTTEARRGAPGWGEDGLDPRRWKALWVTLVAGFMILLDVSIVAVALPSMQRGLGTTPAEVQWVVSGYALTFGLALVPAGRLGDAIGRRRMFMIALAGFVLFSALAGAAPSATLLVLSRLAQGIAAGALAPQNSALIQQLFRGTERARAFGFFGATVGISTAAGPIVGGLILALVQGPDGWRWIFYVNVPIGVVALLLAARLIPRTESGFRGDLDVVGTGLLGGAVLALLLPLVESDSGGLTRLWWLFPVAAVLAAAFVGWERRVARHGGEPLLDVRLLRSRPGFASGVALATIYFVGFSGIWLVFALYFQTGLGYTPLQSGLAVTPFALGSAASSVVGGRLVARLGRLLTVVGLSLVVIGLAATGIVLAIGPAHTAGLLVAAPLLGDLAQHHDDAALRTGRQRGLGWGRAADRAADRVRDRHRHHHGHLLRGAGEQRGRLPQGGGDRGRWSDRRGRGGAAHRRPGMADGPQARRPCGDAGASRGPPTP